MPKTSTITKRPDGKIRVTDNNIKATQDQHKQKNWSQLTTEEKLNLLALHTGFIDAQGNIKQ